jgi:hypothetical protein
MMAQCPNCGYSGKLPSSMESGKHKIRCRKCGVSFETQPAEIGQKGLPDLEADPNGLSDLAIDLGVSPSPEPQEESTVITRIDAGDLKIDASDDEIPIQSQPRAMLPPEPWFYGFLDGWGVFYLCAAAVALFTDFGIILAWGGRAVDWVPVSFLIASIVVVALFGALLLTFAAVIFLFVDQARNIRRLQLRAD